MGLAAAGEVAMLTGLANAAGFASLHSADPGSAGGFELAGGTPAYARLAIVWTLPPTQAGLDSSNAPLFDVPPGAVIFAFGLWTLAVGGSFLGSGLLPLETFTGQGKYRLDTGALDLT